MEFWGTEVPAGKPQSLVPKEHWFIHISQAALGPSPSGKQERVTLRVETAGKEFVLGTLSAGKCDQMALDLIFDKEFKLSHSGTSGSVYLCGYKTEKNPDSDLEFDSEEEEDEEEEEEEDVPMAVPLVKENGGAAAKDGKADKASKNAKALPAAAAANVKAQARAGSKPSLKPGSIDDEAEEDDDSFEDDGDSDDSEDSDGPDDYDEEDSAEDEEELVVTPGNKRPSNGHQQKTPVGGKKARIATPAKPALIASPAPGKKGGHQAKAAAEPKFTPPASGKKQVGGKQAHQTPKKTPGKGGNPKAAATPVAGSGKKGGQKWRSPAKGGK